jgi:hypothetical protein
MHLLIRCLKASRLKYRQQNYNFIVCLTWVWNLVSHILGRIERGINEHKERKEHKNGEKCKKSTFIICILYKYYLSDKIMEDAMN